MKTKISQVPRSTYFLWSLGFDQNYTLVSPRSGESEGSTFQGGLNFHEMQKS